MNVKAEGSFQQKKISKAYINNPDFSINVSIATKHQGSTFHLNFVSIFLIASSIAGTFCLKDDHCSADRLIPEKITAWKFQNQHKFLINRRHPKISMSFITEAMSRFTSIEELVTVKIC